MALCNEFPNEFEQSSCTITKQFFLKIKGVTGLEGVSLAKGIRSISIAWESLS